MIFVHLYVFLECLSIKLYENFVSCITQAFPPVITKISMKKICFRCWWKLMQLNNLIFAENLQNYKVFKNVSRKIQKNIRFMSFILTEVAINVKVWNQYTKSKLWVFWLLSVVLFFVDGSNSKSELKMKKYRGFTFLLCLR